MKKLSARTVLLVLLAITSLLSYVYLNTLETEEPSSVLEENSIDRDEEEDMLDGQQLRLPEIQTIKKAIEAGRRFLPAS